jgi:hypothetical protein
MGDAGQEALKETLQTMMNETDALLTKGEYPHRCFWLFETLWNHRDSCGPMSRLERLRDLAQQTSLRLMVETEDSYDRDRAFRFIGLFGDAAAKQKVAKERRLTIQRERKSKHLCVLCGRRLRLFDKLLKREKHSNCVSFSD